MTDRTRRPTTIHPDQAPTPDSSQQPGIPAATATDEAARIDPEAEEQNQVTPAELYQITGPKVRKDVATKPRALKLMK